MLGRYPFLNENLPFELIASNRLKQTLDATIDNFLGIYGRIYPWVKTANPVIYSCRIEFEIIVEFNTRRYLVCLITYLLENALEALDIKLKSEPNFLPELKLWIDAEAEKLILTVEDNGIGMSQEELSKAFEPLVSFTNKLGLGLFQCQQIVNQFEGTIKIESKIQQSTKATVGIPLDKMGKLSS